MQHSEFELLAKTHSDLDNLQVVLDDAAEILTPTQVFLLGLLVGRSHGQFALHQILPVLLKLQDFMPEAAEDKATIEKQLFEITTNDQLKKIKLQVENSLSLGTGQQDLPEEQSDLVKIIWKELTQVDPTFNFKLGKPDECFLNLKMSKIEAGKVNSEMQIADLQEQIVALSEKFMEVKIKNEELTKKLQQEIQKPKTDETICYICKKKLSSPDFTLTHCSHRFHLKCLADESSKKKPLGYVLKCQFPSCSKTIAREDIEQYQALVEINKHENQEQIFECCCPNTTCSFVYDVSSKQKEKFLLNCPMCSKKWCLKCQANLTKNEHFCLDQSHQFVIKQQKMCPSCKFWVTRNQDKKWMFCRCSKRFCFYCGQEAKKGCVCPSNVEIQNPYENYSGGKLF